MNAGSSTKRKARRNLCVTKSGVAIRLTKI
jgi:hypothetical protein